MVKPHKPTSLAMARFFLSVGNYRQAARELWNSLWSWVPILFVAGLVLSFGYGAMTEGKYILAAVLYLAAAVVIGGKAIHDYRTHVLRKEISVIISLATIIMLGGLIWWVIYQSRHSTIEQKLQEQTEKINEQTQKLDEQKKQLDEITKLLKEQNPQATPDKLQKKYSHGYAIAKFNQNGPATPYDSRFLEGWRFNWSVAAIKEISGGRVEIRLPDITTNTEGTLVNTGVILRKEVGAHVNYGNVDNVDISAEVLAVAQDGVVVLVAFTPSD